MCSLLTPAELKAATGLDYLAGTLDPVGQCLWNTNDSGVNSGDLIIGYIQPQTLAFLKGAFGAGGSDQQVSGHAAFYNPTQGLGTIWIDIGGGQILSISFPRSEDLDPSYQAIALKLAEDALAKM